MSRKQHNFNVRRFYGHDDRGSNDQAIRRVSFKNNFGKMNKTKRIDRSVLNRLGIIDEDVNMAGAGPMSGSGDGALPYRKRLWQFRRYFRGRPGSSEMRPVMDFYQVRIPYGAKHSKEYLVKLLLDELSPIAFVPIAYENRGNDAFFYVDDYNVAQALNNSSNKIELRDGHKMVIKVKGGYPPPPQMDDRLKEKIKTVMASRYITDNKALNLSKFSSDPGLDGMYCALSRSVVLRSVCQIITENIPHLVALNLSGNRIHTLDESGSELRKLKSLKILHLGENNIKSLHTFNCFRDMEITELVIEKNPVCNFYSDKAHFVSEVRKKFPKLLKLDNAELPAVISFDVGQDTKLPQPQASFICNPDGRAVVKTFLQQYFALYDSDNRADLAQAYHDDALFSYCTSYPPNQLGNTSLKLHLYLPESRNLLRVADYRGRTEKLRSGKTSIVSAIKQLPKTQHDLTSFAVDLTLFMPALMSLSVSGVFREPSSGSESKWAIRSFNRTFLIVPVGQGFCITNELYYVTNASEDQQANAFQTDAAKQVIMQSPPTAASSHLPSSTAASPVAAAVPVVPDEAVKMQMVMTLSTQSGMNLEWSQKCLDETQWDFQRAMWTFTELQKQGTIPPQAFIK